MSDITVHIELFHGFWIYRYTQMCLDIKRFEIYY
jgi:hypothetical protein